MNPTPTPSKRHWFILGITVVFGLLLPAFFLLPDDAPAEQVASANVAEDAGESEPDDASDGEDAARHTPGYGDMLLKMVLSLAAVCLLAYVILKWGLGRLYGRGSENEQMEVISRLRLGPKREMLVARVGPRFLILGSTDSEMNVLGELSPEEARAHFATEADE